MFIDDFSIYGGCFELFLENLTKVFHRCEEVYLVLNWKKMSLHGVGRGGFGPRYILSLIHI